MALSSAGAASKIALVAAGATAMVALSACRQDGTGTYSGARR
jgi:formate dehydrogenase assembly factor FdhD